MLDCLETFWVGGACKHSYRVKGFSKLLYIFIKYTVHTLLTYRNKQLKYNSLLRIFLLLNLTVLLPRRCQILGDMLTSCNRKIQIIFSPGVFCSVVCIDSIVKWLSSRKKTCNILTEHINRIVWNHRFLCVSADVLAPSSVL